MKAMIWSQKEKQPIIRYNPPGSETYEELKSRITSFFTVRSYYFLKLLYSISNALLIS